VWRCRHHPRIHYQQAESIRTSSQWHVFSGPLAAHDVNSDGRRLSLYSLSCSKIGSPAVNMSAPELGSTWTWQNPWCVYKFAFTVGAGSMVDTCFRLMVLKPGGLSVPLHHCLWLQWLEWLGWSGGFFYSWQPWQTPSKMTDIVAVAACLLEGWALCSTALVSLQPTAWAGLGAHLASMW